jgi:hypothetical protein
MSMYVVVALILALVVGAVALLRGDSTDPNRSTAQENTRLTTQRSAAPTTMPTTTTKQP